jgi:dihydrofolate reductase
MLARMNTLIVAMDEDRLIGRGDEIPWRLPEDLKMFRAHTLGKTVIMGRRTWQSLPTYPKRPYLDGRVNMVITRAADRYNNDLAAAGEQTDPEGPWFMPTIEVAVSTARRRFPEFVDEFVIMGGRQIYELALRRDLVDRMIATHVPGKHIGDVYFPEIPAGWRETAREAHDGFDVATYEKG